LLSISACSASTPFVEPHDAGTEDSGFIEERVEGGPSEGGVVGNLTDSGVVRSPTDAGSRVDADAIEGIDAEAFEDSDILGPVDADIGEPEDGGLPRSYCTPEYRLSGDGMPVTLSACGSEMPEDAPLLEIPLWLGGGLTCSPETAWAGFEVSESMRLRFTLQDSRNVSLELISPEGESLFELGPEYLCVEIDIEPGFWALAATPTIGEEGSTSYFEFFIDRLGLEE